MYQFADSLIIAGDGYFYVPYTCVESVGPNGATDIVHLLLTRVNSQGASDTIRVTDWIRPSSDTVALFVPLITNADTGVALTWTGAGASSGGQGMAITNGTSVSLSGPVISGQDVEPVLQAQDGSFVGQYQDDNSLQYSMVAFDQSGNVRWIVPNDQPQIATADGGVIGQSGVTYDQNGNATGQMINLPTQSWLGYSYQLGSVESQVASAFAVASSWWAWAKANASRNGTGLDQDWFPSLDRCTRAPGCIGHYDAIYNALSDFLVRLSDATVSQLAQSKVFDKVRYDANGVAATTMGFINYLRHRRPGFYDGTRSTYCEEALTTPSLYYPVCATVLINQHPTSVKTYLQAHSTDAITGTPSYPLLTFWMPSFILYDNLGMNLGNEGTIFHEALHGYTGQFDLQLMSDFSINTSQPICEITTYLQNSVLLGLPGLNPAVTSCP